MRPKFITIQTFSHFFEWLKSRLDGKVDKVSGKGLSTYDYTSAAKSKVEAIPASPKYTDTITTINGKTGAITKADITALGIPAQDTVYTHPTTHSISEVSGLQTALDGKVDDSRVLTDVPLNAEFTDTVTTINSKTGAISKADIVALGIPSQDTIYNHPSTHPASMITESSTKRFVSDSEKSAWNSKSDTDTVTTINGKTGAITKADIVALGIPAQDTVVDISGKADKTYVDNKVKTDVPVGAKFTDTVYTHPASHPASMITGLPTSLPANGGNADTVGGFTVGVNVPANAKFTDTNTTYSEISTAEIDAGTASTGRTITGRRVQYILDKISSMISVAIGALTKSSVGLGNVDNTSDANKPISTATQAALNGKVNSSQVLTNVPSGAKFTDTVTTINGKTGAISKSDITALGIPAQDTVYTHPSTHPASMITQDSARRMVSDTQIAAWNGKSDINHTHGEYAPKTHSHSEYPTRFEVQTAVQSVADPVIVLTEAEFAAIVPDVTKIYVIY